MAGTAKSRAALQTQSDTGFPTGTGSIAAADHRQYNDDGEASAVNIIDDNLEPVTGDGSMKYTTDPTAAWDSDPSHDDKFIPKKWAEDNFGASARALVENFQFSANIGTLRESAYEGLITVSSLQLTAGLSAIAIRTSLDNGATFTAQASVAALNAWIIANITGDTETGTPWQIELTATFNASELKEQWGQLVFTRP